MVVTEVGCMGVKPGLDVMNDATREGQILTGVWKTIAPQPGGPQRIYWGTELEEPTRIWAFFDWNSIEEHRKFAESFGEEAVKDLPLVLSFGEFSKHLALTPFPPLVMQSPVTEVILAYFPSDISLAQKDKATAQVRHFVENSQTKCSEIGATAYGWGVENDFPVRGIEGQNGTVLAAFLGWPTLDAHTQFREAEASKQDMKLVKNMEGLLSLITFHLSCRTLAKGQH